MALEAPACCSFWVLLLHDPELPIDGFPSSALVRLGPGIVPCEGFRNERGEAPGPRASQSHRFNGRHVGHQYCRCG